MMGRPCGSLPQCVHGARRRSRIATLALVALLAVLLWPAAAVAHPGLIETTPGAGYAVTSAPEAISVTFNEPVTPVEPALVLRLSDGEELPLAVSISQDKTSLRGTPDGRLAAASYEASYRVVALDGDLIEGTFAFGAPHRSLQEAAPGRLRRTIPIRCSRPRRWGAPCSSWDCRWHSGVQWERGSPAVRRGPWPVSNR